MNLALRLMVACLVIAGPTVLFLAMMRGLEKMRDDALLLALAERDDAPRDVSNAAAEALNRGPIRADGRGADADDDPASTADAPASTADDYALGAFTCSTCGASNMTGAKYCGQCLGELNR
ncbi:MULTISPECIES: zinc ribbon domain-containing protein [Halorussus]|uniref:zinc ribbon domain-containing protein n=1 Tax=Halorussus TaxID=1070314 RepID=UPI000E20DBFD|nr:MULTISPECIES: zinc ribbon domain-containing protein [Halorussus]NHN59359.1 zinc ribbon domain-containing protein [Halorussus sp. JP-T4]